HEPNGDQRQSEFGVLPAAEEFFVDIEEKVLPALQLEQIGDIAAVRRIKVQKQRRYVVVAQPGMPEEERIDRIAGVNPISNVRMARNGYKPSDEKDRGNPAFFPAGNEPGQDGSADQHRTKHLGVFSTDRPSCQEPSREHEINSPVTQESVGEYEGEN